MFRIYEPLIRDTMNQQDNNRSQQQTDQTSPQTDMEHQQIKQEIDDDDQYRLHHDNVLTPPQSEPTTSPRYEDTSLDSPPNPEQGTATATSTPTSKPARRERPIKCKNCPFSAATKDEYYEHRIIHIRPGKALRCDRCKFVTEYKHHLEFHLSNHLGAKPYNCQHCSYACVNKSMLTSHLKSHSNLYPFNCGDCSYRAKYQHTFKEHLRKTSHRPGEILNEDGTVNTSAVIDVHSRRRGPRVRPRPLPVVATPPQPIIAPPDMFQMATLYRSMMLLQAVITNDQAARYSVPQIRPPNNDEVLDLSSRSAENNSPRTASLSGDHTDQSENHSEESTEETHQEEMNNNHNQVNYCRFCELGFRNHIMYTLHMEFHSREDPRKCAKCERSFKSALQFFHHLQTEAH